jgi:aspartyl-tRNA(Asn)/glutamyl-tRNA(Gln) amidotransferase subunit A
MTGTAYWRWSLRTARAAILGGEVSPVELVTSVLSRIEERSALNANISVLADAALAEAQQREESLRRGDKTGPLFGIPIALKDNIAARGAPTTAGSRIRADWIAEADADVLTALRAAGAVLVAKNNLFEFAYGAAHPRFGETLNPWNPELTCGGSSSGSAAAVADGEAFGAVGSDTGGSIRIPAAMCGIVGLKPSRGRISNRGVIPVSGLLDVVGPMTRSVDDAALMFEAMGGGTPPVSAPGRRLTIGFAEGPFLPRLAALVEAAFALALRRLEEAGCVVKGVPLPDMTLAREVMWTIASADAAEFHRETLLARPEDYCEEVRRNLLGGAMISAVDYIGAHRLRRRLGAEMRAAMTGVDAILMPSMAGVPYKSGLQRLIVDGVEEGVLPRIMGFTPLANLTGQPAVVVPVDLAAEGIPLTVQFYGHHGLDETLLDIARLVERPAVTFPGTPEA